MEHKLTESEIRILRLLVEAMMEFETLPVYFDSHTSDFVKAIHDAQQIVLSRLTIRIHPELFGGDGGKTFPAD